MDSGREDGGQKDRGSAWPSGCLVFSHKHEMSIEVSSKKSSAPRTEHIQLPSRKVRRKLPTRWERASIKDHQAREKKSLAIYASVTYTLSLKISYSLKGYY